jgi:hypothetical protein
MGAGASLPILAVLVRKSLLWHAIDQRHQIHELLRQYAQDHLAQASPTHVASTRDLHSSYFIAFLSNRNAAMNGGRKREATAEIGAGLENVRTAWHWAVERGQIASLASAANALYVFCQFRSRYLDGIRLFELAVERLDDRCLAEAPHAALHFDTRPRLT